MAPLAKKVSDPCSIDIHDIQRFTVISQPFSEFWLVTPYGDQWASVN